MKLEDKHLEHIAKMNAITDQSWSSWNSPVGLTIFFIGFTLFLDGLAIFAMLVRYIFILK